MIGQLRYGQYAYAGEGVNLTGFNYLSEQGHFFSALPMTSLLIPYQMYN